MKIFHSHACTEYKQEGHPEAPSRVKRVHSLLKDEFDFTEARPCSRKDLLAVHSPQLVDAVIRKTFADADTPALPNMYEHAARAAGAAAQAAQHALSGRNAFSLMRPPGHHAGRSFLGGFCYFNNIAIATKRALAESDRIAIIDIDGHHGNGTQDIFLGADNVLFISLHQQNAFPRTGYVSERNCINYPLSQGTGPEKYMTAFTEGLKRVEQFNPDLIAVSAGFDAYKDDPLLALGLDIRSYFDIGRAIAHCNQPVFAVLEGGYSDALPQCVRAFLRGLGD